MPAAISYLNFDLLITRAEGGGYQARVLSSPAGEEAAVNFDVPVSDLELENFFLRAGRPRGTRRIRSPEMEAVRNLGKRLYDTVFSGEVRACWRTSLNEAEKQNAGLRLRLHIAEVPELNDIPWEYLYNTSLNRFLSLSEYTPIIRYLNVPEGVRSLAIVTRLEILVIISSPTDHSGLDVEYEWSRLNEALAGLIDSGQVQLHRLIEARLSVLQRALRRGEYHVLHFIGHGGFDPGTQEGVLIFCDEAGHGRRVTAEQLSTILHDHSSLRLVVLNACEGSRSSRVDPFAGVAQTLVQQRVPAVIAMQFEITDRAAVSFADEFYAATADGYPVDASLAAARKAMFVAGNDIEWGELPVLYLRAPDGRLFSVDSAAGHNREQERQQAGAQRKAEEERAAEAQRKAEEERAAEAQRKAEEARAAEAQRKAEEARAAEAQRKAEEERAAEAQRKAEEARAAEAQRKAEEARAAEAQRKAEEERAAEAQRKAEEERAAEAQRKAEEERAAEAQRKAEEERRQRKEEQRQYQEEERRRQALPQAQRESDQKQEEKEQPQWRRLFLRRPAAAILVIAAVLVVPLVSVVVLVLRQIPGPPMATLATPSPAPKSSAAEALQKGHEAHARYDSAETMRWYRKAADQGNADAQYNIGFLYESGDGVAQDHAEAMVWFRKAADQGNAAAQFETGFLYGAGWGVAQDYAEAMRWYRKAADQGNAAAQNNIGVLYENGWGVAQDHAEAMRWYRKAADQGNAAAQYNIGLLYENGWGVAQDHAEAMRWFRKAADQGYEEAKEWLASH